MEAGNATADGACACRSGFQGDSCQSRVEQFRVARWAQGVIAGSVVLVVGAVVFIWYMIRKERRGEPLFVSLTQPLMEGDAGDEQRGGGDGGGGGGFGGGKVIGSGGGVTDGDTESTTLDMAAAVGPGKY